MARSTAPCRVSAPGADWACASAASASAESSGGVWHIVGGSDRHAPAQRSSTRSGAGGAALSANTGRRLNLENLELLRGLAPPPGLAWLVRYGGELREVRG